ncbi:diacylglycerol kinase family protein [Dyadobacter sp. CY312]|uniref:diacylglycerol/lipid kinase family protein n=1 Tax=Dyadobacter sp. CY312 TaxID=2907303 RepID=UPI001F2B2EC0|nr:diacylglycerol kinase family protein [Dyadobacter sp. CY312]MCE7042218.1 diacylglycerol kinase [Dyadobacter sp. CY312]
MADYLFILNPNSGTSIGKNIDAVAHTIDSFAEKTQNSAHILFTEGRGHATELVRENVDKNKWKAIVAVGGDGTVNEIAQPLIGHATPVGILPVGSGNGLARHLGLPLTLEASLEKLFGGSVITIDNGLINDMPFFCTAGMGFDAYVGQLFSQQLSRGLATYINVSFKAYWDYKPQVFRVNGQKTDAFSLTFANAGQFGNNAWVAPHASLQDGILDECTIKPFPKWFGTSLAYQLFTKQLKTSKYISYRHITETLVETDTPPIIHYDGEPFQLETNKIRIKINPQSLNVIV